MPPLGPVMLDVAGVTLTPEDREVLDHPQVGGVILFTRNYQAVSQLKELLRELREVSAQHLLIAVDQEGGRVQRFREEFSQLPPLGDIGQLYEKDAKEALALAEQHAWKMATEVRACNIDFSFAPILDLNKKISEVIGNRAFHRDPEIVVDLVKAYISGMRRAGMAAVGKHFPGHGSVAADSHSELPVDPRSFEEISKEDLVPFVKCVHELRGVMPAHVSYSAVDSFPPCFSSFWLQKILRKQLKFDGAIFSDDLSMAAANFVGDTSDRAKLALEAGCDMVLVCNDRKNAICVLETLERQAKKPDLQSISRLQKMKGF